MKTRHKTTDQLLLQIESNDVKKSCRASKELMKRKLKSIRKDFKSPTARQKRRQLEKLYKRFPELKPKE